MESAGQDQHSLLTHFLADRDVLCPSCAYNVRGLTGNRCPECGLELAVRLALAEPRTGRYIAAVMALTLCGGGFALFVLIFMLIAIREGLSSQSGIFAWAVVYPAATATLHLTALTMLLRARGRRWFRTVPDRTSRVVTGTCVAAAAGCIVAWVAWMLFIMP